MDDDFKDIAKRAEAEYRAEIAAAYGDETAGRDAPRMARHLPGAVSTESAKKRAREADQRILSALERLLLDDPIYRARYEAFGVFLTHAESRADDLLARAQARLDAVNDEIDGALDRAPKLNGKAIFRHADGRVIDEDGNEIPVDQVEGIVWPEGAMSAEEYLALLDRRDELETILAELQEVRVGLGETRNEYENQESPIHQDRMDEKESLHQGQLDDLSVRVDALVRTTAASATFDQIPMRGITLKN